MGFFWCCLKHIIFISPANQSTKILFVSVFTELDLRISPFSAPPAPARHGVCCIYHFLAIVCQKKPLLSLMLIKNTQWHIQQHLPLMVSSGVLSEELVFTQKSVWVTAWKNHLVPRESVDKTSSKKTPRHGASFSVHPSMDSKRPQPAKCSGAHSHDQGILSCAIRNSFHWLQHMLTVTKRFTANNIGQQLSLLSLSSGCSSWLQACK